MSEDFSISSKLLPLAPPFLQMELQLEGIRNLLTSNVSQNSKDIGVLQGEKKHKS